MELNGTYLENMYSPYRYNAFEWTKRGFRNSGNFFLIQAGLPYKLLCTYRSKLESSGKIAMLEELQTLILLLLTPYVLSGLNLRKNASKESYGYTCMGMNTTTPSLHRLHSLHRFCDLHIPLYVVGKDMT